MTRIAIVGNAGGGKSLLARALGESLGLPVRVIDDVQWRPGWTPAPGEAVRAAHAAWLAEPRWVIDGWGSFELMTERFAAADTIVLVDFPLRVHYRWALKRQLEVALGIRRDWPPPGCRALPMTRELLRLMKRVDEEFLPPLVALLDEPRFRTKVVRLRSPSALRAWRAEATGKR